MKAINLKGCLTKEAAGVMGEKIEAALRAVNGKASSHTYTQAGEIYALSDAAEQRLEELGIPKAERVGAIYRSVSGGSVPNAYKYSRLATWVKLEKRSSGWFFVEACAAQVYKDAPKGQLSLTPKQDAIAVAKLRAGYVITQ